MVWRNTLVLSASHGHRETLPYIPGAFHREATGPHFRTLTFDLWLCWEQMDTSGVQAVVFQCLVVCARRAITTPLRAEARKRWLVFCVLASSASHPEHQTEIAYTHIVRCLRTWRAQRLDDGLRYAAIRPSVVGGRSRIQIIVAQ